MKRKRVFAIKKFIVFSIAIICIFAIYHDFKYGALRSLESISIPTIAPIPLENEIQSDEHDDSQLQLSENKLRYQLLEAGPGATVLSISEKLHNGSLPVSIEQLIADFKQLNDGTAPEKIQIGKVYKFPIYLPE